MLFESLAQLDERVLQELCKSRCPESQTLEFKRDLPGNADKDKQEICKDVTAMANTDGGDLVYGIDEKAGAAFSVSAMSGEPPDAAMRRINQVLDAGIEPRIHGLKMQHIGVSGGYVIVLRVPASYDGPHCVRHHNHRRFVMRNGTGVTDMSFDQLRGAFERTATLAERARHFIDNRLELIVDRRTPAPLVREGPHYIVHLIPVAGLAGRRTVDLKSIYKTRSAGLFDDGWHGGSQKFNFDGLLIQPPGDPRKGYYAYRHIFRTGALEGAQLAGKRRKIDTGSESETPIIWSLDMSKFFYRSIERLLAALQNWGFSGPALMSIGILDVKDYWLGINRHEDIEGTPADRLQLVPPASWIEDIESVYIDAEIRPLLDTLWQAFGFERCLDFDDLTGAFTPRKSA